MKFTVNLTYTQTCRAEIEIEADNLEEAQEFAEGMQSDDIPEQQLNPIHGEITVDSVEPK